MRTPLVRYSPLPGFGMTSLVLGVIAMLLGPLPVLGIPIGAFGLLFGILGLLLAPFSSTSSLRWSLGGVAACCLALGVNYALYYAPEGYLPGRSVPQLWQTPPDRPYVSPPAPPRWPGAKGGAGQLP